MLAQPKILIANSSAPWRDHCRQTLAPLPADLVEAGDAQAVLHAARQSDLALILLDTQLPQMCAFEVAARLRSDPRTAGTPVILTDSAGFSAERIRNGYRAGAVDCLLNMPAESDVLRQKAGVFVELARRRMALERAVRRAERYCNALKEHRKAAWLQATHDPLTGLPNRALFDDRLEQSLRQALRTQQRFAVGFMDLDDFKQVNDRYGHAAGDQLLAGIAARLKQVLREADTIARIGGDEFALLFRDVGLADACHFLQHKLHRALCEPVTLASTLDGRPVRIRPRASIGIALYPEHARESGALLKMADGSMYAAKRAGGGVCLCGDGGARLALPMPAGV
jgi:diguanylate cyclase (GGDEF)-like protein